VGSEMCIRDRDFLIMHEEKAVDRALRRTKAKIKNMCYNILVGVKRIGRKVLRK